MAKIKHDADGFLTGEAVDMGRIQAVWDEMHDDLREIRRVLTQHGVVGRGVAPAIARRVGAGDGAAPASDESFAAMRATQQAIRRAAAKPAVRDARGRFVGANKNDAPKSPGAGGGSGGGGGGEGSEEGRMRAFADRLVGAVKESGSGIEEADPAVKAFNEVARPLARGYEMIGGGKEKRQEGLLRRIYSTLTGFRKEETGFSKATNKTLKSIDGKAPTAPGGAASNGMFGGLMSKLPSVGGLISGAGGSLLSMGKGLAGAGKGLLRRVPLLGTLLAGASAVSDIFSTETDDSLTRREKDGRDGKAAGGFAGSVGGMLVGAKLGAAVGTLAGPIGTAIGGVVGGAAGMFFGEKAGDIMGETIGGWVSDLREADIPGKITAAWDTTTDYMKKGWGGALDRLSEGWAGLQKAGKNVANWAEGKLDSANSFVRDATGVDVKAGLTNAKAQVVELGGQAIEGVKAGAQWTAENTAVGRGASKVVSGARTAGDWILGQTSKLFESGKGGAGTVSSGKGDLGGASYGTYQLSSSQGTLQNFLKSSKYGDQFAGLKPGSPEFNAKWKEVAAADPSFAGAQHDFIKSTHYDPALAGLKDGGIDLSGRGAAVQDALWSTSVQFGAGNSKKGAVSMFQKALAGKDLSSLSDEDIVSAVQDYKIANNDKLFASSSQAVRAGTAGRAKSEKERLLALAASGDGPPAVAAAPQAPVGVAAPAVPAVASTNVPSVSVAPVVPAVAEAPSVAVPLASNASDRPVQVAVKAPDAGQDLRERGIAHVATGGLSG
ncbi:MAG: hypothetical protein GAK28_04797 [Luteibacter sp.]|uniref:VgrG-related protein n=1 Tax=Luteibacter sp. TaxID=1886636 RepID=UPI00137F341B|nr:chitosanase [Luteibacter sp.]KAF1003292.1 MAG: hypothetical protein GAK28_04797 [Luteibacter sp.]